MAKVTEIRYFARATVNVGNYESVALEYGEVVSVDSRDDVASERKKLVKRVEGTLENRVIATRRDAKQEKSR